MNNYKSIKNLFIYCGLIVITVVTVFPLLWCLSASLRSDTEFFKYITPFSINTLIPIDFTLDSYILLFTKFNFARPIINTVVVSLATIIGGCLLNSVAAFAFACFKFKFKNVLFAIFLVSFMVPFEAISLPLYKVVSGLGWMNTYAGMIVPTIASGLVLFLFTQFFRDIPPSILEAARVDGANLSQIFTKIVLPSSITVFITASLIIFMDQWNAYLWPLLVARSKDIQTIQIALSAFKMERVTLWSCLYAGSMISAIVPLGLFLPTQKYFVQGITSSGVKG